jgi:hypothetical protein
MKPPWPSDCIVIVAELEGRENRAGMESVVRGFCRDCEAPVAADGFTVRASKALPSRHGRPVKFLCVRCYVKYDLRTITEFHDHRV